MSETCQVNVRLPVELAARLRQHSRVTRTREGLIVAEALAAFLPPLPRPPQLREVMDRDDPPPEVQQQ